jgi:hypothetical protein
MNRKAKEIKKKAQKQFDDGSDMEQMVVAKYFDAMGGWKWFLMNMDKDEDYCWGIVKGHEVEMGSFSIKELQSMSPRIQRDLYFEPVKASEIWEQLNKGEWV